MDVKDMIHQLKALNITEKEFLNWGKDDLKRLSQGFMTKNMKTVEVDNKKFKVKLSFKNGKLMVHPKKKAINNTLKFSHDHLNKLKKGEPVFRDRSVYQLDRDINELLSIKSSKLVYKLPNEINGIKLSQAQKKDISEGKEIDNRGTTKFIYKHLDLNDPMLFTGLNLAKRNLTHKNDLLNKSSIKQSNALQNEIVNGRSNTEVKKVIKPAKNNKLNKDTKAKEAQKDLNKAKRKIR